MIYKRHILKILFSVFILLHISCVKKTKKSEDGDVTKVENVQVLDSTMLRKGISLKHPSEFDSILVYTVQIGAFSKRNSSIEKSTEVQLVQEGDSLIKYRFGNFDTYKEAKAFRKTAQSLYPDAFIVPIHKGLRVDIKKALELSDEATKD